MKARNLPSIKFLLLLLLCVNYKHFVKSLSINQVDNDFLLTMVEGSGMDPEVISINNQHEQVLNFEKKMLILEAKLNSLSGTFDQLEKNNNIAINNHMDFLELNLRTAMDEIIEQKLKLSSKKSSFYNVQEIKCSNNRLPKNCYEVEECNSNIYSLMIPTLSDKPFAASCESKTFDGGWLVIQRRQDGSENFYRNWTDYVEGFGDLNGEFFIGLKKLHALTSLGQPHELYIMLKDFEGDEKYARYKQFKVDSESTDFMLTVNEYSGNAGDCLSYHSGQKFTTKDHDNDDQTFNCAERWKGAWWYKACYKSNLNSQYLGGKLKKSHSGEGISWCNFRGYDYSLKFVQMMIRPKQD